MIYERIAFISGRSQVKKVLLQFKDKTLFYPLDFISKSQLSEKKISYQTFNEKKYNPLKDSARNKAIDYMDKLSQNIENTYARDSLEEIYLIIIKDALIKSLFFTIFYKSVISEIIDKNKTAGLLINCPINQTPDISIERIIYLLAKETGRNIHISRINGLTLFKEKILNYLVKSRFSLSGLMLITLSYLPSLLKILQKIRRCQCRSKKIDKRSIDKKKIIILPGQYSEYLKSILPVIRSLSSTYEFTPVIFNNLFNNSSKILKRNNIPWNNYESYIDNEEITRYDKHYQEAKNNILKALKSILEKDDPLYWEILFFDLEKTLNKPRFKNIPLYLSVTSKIIEKEKPDLIVLPDDASTLSRTTLLISKKNKIKTLITPNVFLNPLSDKEPLWSLKLTAGMAQYNYEINKGVSKDRLKITGSPQFDALFKKTSFIKKKEICNYLNIPEDKNIFLFTMQAFKDNDGIIKILCETMENFKDSCLIIRPHPIQTTLVYKYILNRLRAKNVIITKSFGLYDIINIADLIISVSSITILEAITLNKPVIVLNPIIKDYLISSCTGNLIEYAENTGNISKKIQDILYDLSHKDRFKNEHAKFIRDFISFGPSIPRIIETIDSVVGN